MKKHTTEFLTEYGVKNYKDSLSSSMDGYPNDGKWYHKMDDGFVCGDTYTVLRIRMRGDMPMRQEYKDLDNGQINKN